MTPETLRIACERAGITVWPEGGAADGTFGAEYSSDHPPLASWSEALLPLVAERLLVRCLREDRFTEYRDILNFKYGDLALAADDEKRILAALVALGDITIEQAREEVETA